MTGHKAYGNGFYEDLSVDGKRGMAGVVENEDM